ncbi:hypothetical protein ACIP5U_21390 [Streptomyces sp. NPDC088788]|uniref:hypothetical protein n=1 Tax=Streptomyces sp. NPDC088788 TaxID=3365898 RepID=UPI00381A1440
MTYKQSALVALAVCAFLSGTAACSSGDARPRVAASGATGTATPTEPPRCVAAKYTWSKPTKHAFLAGVSEPHVLGKGGGGFTDAAEPVPHPKAKVTVEQGPDVDPAAVVRKLEAYSDLKILYGPGEIEPGRSEGSVLSYTMPAAGVYVQLKFGQAVEADFRRTCRGGVAPSRGHAVGIRVYGGSTVDCTEAPEVATWHDKDRSLVEASRQGVRTACPTGSRALGKS